MGIVARWTVVQKFACFSLGHPSSGERSMGPHPLFLFWTESSPWIGNHPDGEAIGEGIIDWVWWYLWPPSPFMLPVPAVAYAAWLSSCFRFKFQCLLASGVPSWRKLRQLTVVMVWWCWWWPTCWDAGTQMLISNLTKKMLKAAKGEIGPCRSLAQRRGKPRDTWDENDIRPIHSKSGLILDRRDTTEKLCKNHRWQVPTWSGQGSHLEAVSSFLFSGVGRQFLLPMGQFEQKTKTDMERAGALTQGIGHVEGDCNRANP